MTWGVHFLFIIVSFFCLNKAHSYQQLGNILNDPVFDLEAFINDVNSKGEKQSLESTLIELKNAEPNFFDQYVLMYKSRSLQTSSFMFPRVLLNSPNSTTIISFNGDPSDNGYDKLEVMRFDPQSTKFTFNEISFLDGELNLSENNPQKCMNCHQNSKRIINDPRPNWEPYSIWPGAYSSLAVGGHDLFNPNSPKHDPILTADAKSENEMYQLFLDEVALDHPRYRLLRPMEPNDRGRYFPALDTPKEAPNKFTTIITDQLLNLNTLRIARLIKDTEILTDYKKVIYALAKCQRLYLPDEIFNWHKGHIHPHLEESNSLEEYAQAIELIFEPYNISTQDWSMDFGTGAKFAFRHRFGGPSSFNTPFKKALELVMPELKGQKCSDIKAELLSHDFRETQNLRNKIDLNDATGESDSQPLISRCISCHTSSSFGAPYIPFDDETRLSSVLQLEGYPRGTLKEEIFYRVGVHAQFFERMPADGYFPTTLEIETLKNYLNEL